MEARNQSYRDKADKFAARPITGNTYTEKTENLTNAIARIIHPQKEERNIYKALFITESILK